MAVSKIVYDGRALIDLTVDTVTADASLGADGDIYLDLG